MFITSRMRPIIKYSLIGGAIGSTALSLQRNQYEWDSIGIVRLSRAAVTVFKIGVIYKKDLYGKGLDKKSQEYKDLKVYIIPIRITSIDICMYIFQSICHQRCAEKLLELCCANRGVYIKVGQHIAALDYLLPSEYVQTMKVLHSQAPTTDIKDIYKVIKEDLKKDVCNVVFLSPFFR